MAELYLCCSRDLAIWLGACPARVVPRTDLSFPVYDIPPNFIEVDTGEAFPLVWGIVSDETSLDECI